MSTPFNGNGVLSMRDEKLSRNNKPYFSLQIGNNKLSAWGKSMNAIKNIPLGTYVEFTAEKDENGYNNLLTATPCNPPAESTNNTTNTRLEARTAALNAALQLILAPSMMQRIDSSDLLKNGTYTYADVILSEARKFEDWLTREETTPGMPTEEVVE